ncbi:hypothetical protein L1987_66463 [Smallanthus sonchifolius]|uniref:Uncharacterized protein n=1 Tax=Smallanthus sonchifolius TaxID=185202 RepID=A0ACB9BX72_9ASTR|nr:hypothetical protein L1987_66463 [Smallanthus sonchifolius]
MAQIQVQQPPPVSGPNGAAAAAATVNAGGVVATAVAAVAVAGANQSFGTTSLYVGDLEFGVTDSQLYDLFNQIGPVVSVRVCRDLSTRRSLGYGYVNYSNANDAASAISVLNFTPVNGRSIRIMYSHRDPSVRKSGSANLFIKNLDKTIDNKALHDTFTSFGNILSCKIATDSTGQSKGYGFVQFDTEEAAQNAIGKLNGMLMNDKQVYVGPFLRKQERDSSSSSKFNNVYVKNLSESTTDEDLKKTFGEYGAITSVVVMKDGEGKSKGFGFVNFENADAAANAVESLNGKKIDDKELYVGKAQKKSEREFELKNRFEQSVKEAADKYQGANLYVKNLDDTIDDDDKLKKLFSEYGTITSCKVMLDPNGNSRGSGFVAFSTPEEASQALTEMNGKMVVSKPLYVALAQRKEERRAKVQAQFSQMRPVTMGGSMGPRMPIYPPGGPGLGQQLYYGPAPPAMLHPQAGFGYQQQLVPGMRPGVLPMSNFFVPVAQQGQHFGGRRGPGSVHQQNQQSVPMMPQQTYPRGRMYRFPGRNAADSVPYEIGGVVPRNATMGQPMPITALTSALANASPEQQRTMLGENLYPLVDQLEHENAAKVTGMLLEMDQTEVLHLLESPDALKAKVSEAMEVLKSVQQQANSPAAQLASLSLKDNLVS